VLAELRVTQLGVIEDVRVVLSGGMTALTGETGAGKTLLVDAIELLLGGSADSELVRPGAAEATVEGRFANVTLPGAVDGEMIVTRVIPASGRSRAYLNGRMIAVAHLQEIAAGLVDIHGQHTQQSLLSQSRQRAALDTSGSIDTADVVAARRAVRDIRAAQQELGGDPRDRARELDLLSYQLKELDSAALEDEREEESLRDEEERLADASGLREAAGSIWSGLSGDDGVVDRLGVLVNLASLRRPLAGLESRLRALETELSEAAREARTIAEGAEDDPERLASVGARRQVLTDLRRKYGETLGEVIEFREELRRRIEELASHEERAAALDQASVDAQQRLTVAEEALWSARTAAAPRMSEAVQDQLRQLAMPKARFEVHVGEEPGSDAVTWLLGANPGEPVLPLSKVASGGELSRAMLAIRLVLGPRRDERSDGADPETLIFDEVDAGVGGEAALSVGRALARLGDGRQVLVVTHLPQVAAHADRQLVVSKTEIGGRTVAAVQAVDGPERVVEVSRMLSGSPDSETARMHAEELLARGATGT
jgi:DNA repair protein RecN (Recombination protein N)